MNTKEYDVVIIGGGFYGCMIALYLQKFVKRVVILEKEELLLSKASYHNQARIHNGYHYPRSFVTGLRSHINYIKFSDEFKESVCDTYIMMYGIARNSSKVTSSQFIKFCKQIGAPLKQIPYPYKNIFNESLIEDAFVVEEAVFDAAVVRKKLEERLHASGVSVLYKTEALSVHEGTRNIEVKINDGRSIFGKSVYLSVYANINTILTNSSYPTLPLKHEYAEMPLVVMPEALKKLGITIMDGPFFSIMPFPDRNLHSFHHVRYTPRFMWTDSTLGLSIKNDLSSNFTYMYKDAQRYIPTLKDIQYRESLYEVKTILLQNEMNDGRPILFRKNYEIKNFNIVMGGKIDNIYDITTELQKNFRNIKGYSTQ